MDIDRIRALAQVYADEEARIGYTAMSIDDRRWAKVEAMEKAIKELLTILSTPTK